MFVCIPLSFFHTVSLSIISFLLRLYPSCYLAPSITIFLLLQDHFPFFSSCTTCVCPLALLLCHTFPAMLLLPLSPFSPSRPDTISSFAVCHCAVTVYPPFHCFLFIMFVFTVLFPCSLLFQCLPTPQYLFFVHLLVVLCCFFVIDFRPLPFFFQALSHMCFPDISFSS